MDIQSYIESGIIESYVLGFLSEAESLELESLSRQYPEINQAIENFTFLFENETKMNEIMPPPALKSKIFEALKNEFSEEKEIINEDSSPVVNFLRNDQVFNKETYFWKYIAAAAIILFVVSGFLNVYLYNNYSTVSSKYQSLLIDKTNLQANNEIYKTRINQYQNSIAILQNPDVKVIKLEGIPGKEGNIATLYWNAKLNQVFLYNNKLQETPEGKQYQLWAIVSGKPVDAGVIEDCDGICKLNPSNNDLKNAQAFAITLEQKGGSPSPTLTAMFVMGKV